MDASSRSVSQEQQHQTHTACLHARSPFKADAKLSGPRRGGGGYFYIFRAFTLFLRVVSFDSSQVEDADQDADQDFTQTLPKAQNKLFNTKNNLCSQ